MEPFTDTVTVVISGGANGADALGERWAKEFGKSLEIYPADWDTHGKAAGYIRNKAMCDVAEGLIAFSVNRSKGTANMIDLAIKHKKAMIVVFNVYTQDIGELIPY
jgi:hypothetical protein